MNIRRALITLCTVLGSVTSVCAIELLDDTALSDVSAQAAFYTNYIAPGGDNPNADTGFYKLGLQGTMELNANIGRIQLGCGGVKGPGCDIDLEKVRITGTKPDASGNYAGSDAKLTNPFLELAIKNPTTLATRQVVGINLGAQSIQALLSIGTNPNPSTPGGAQTGINSISGAFTASLSNLSIPLSICTLPFCILPLTGNAFIADTAAQPGGVYSQQISGSRMKSISVGRASLGLSGGLVGVLGALVGNINATIPSQNLIDLHNLDVSSTPTAGLSLSLNSQPITWSQQGTSGVRSWAKTPAQQGWWLAVPNVKIGGTPDNPIVTSRVTTDIFGALAALSNLNISSINSGQIPVQNCFGGLKFC